MNYQVRPSTIAVTAGRPRHEPDAPLNAPLAPASTYVAGGEREYGRYGNPTWEAFETVLGQLEGGRAITFSSGLAAIASLLETYPVGITVVVPKHAYLGVLGMLREREERGLVSLRLVDLEDTAAVCAACEGADLVWLESPTNPMLELADIPTISAAAHAQGATVVVDNTFATPLLQQPLSLGADVVVHSATKYLAGHSDAVIGAVVTRDDELFARLDSRRRSLGAIPGVLESWLAARGVRTLHLRVERAQDNARELVRRLETHSNVSRVRYPGFGGIVCIEVGSPDGLAADAMVHGAKLWIDATSLGGVESTWERRRRWPMEPDTIPPNLVRLSVGIEDVEDLWADLDRALSSSLD